MLISEFIDPRGPINDVPDSEAAGCIYVIENKHDHRKYVGKTIDFARRASEYGRQATNFLKYTKRNPIITELGIHGIENFTMRRYYNCRTTAEMDEMERTFIHNLRTTDPVYGYNMNATKTSTNQRSEETIQKLRDSHIGNLADAQSRGLRSNACIAICPEQWKICISQSMQLFGEVVVDATKDIISAAGRRGNRIRGYIVYTDKIMEDVLFHGKVIWLNRPVHLWYAAYLYPYDIGRWLRDGFDVKHLILDKDRGYKMVDMHAWYRE